MVLSYCENLQELSLHSNHIREELLGAVDHSGNAQGIDLHSLLHSWFGQMFANFPQQTKVTLSVFFGGQALDIQQTQDVHNEACDVSMQRKKFQNRPWYLVPLDGSAYASPEQIVNQ